VQLKILVIFAISWAVLQPVLAIRGTKVSGKSARVLWWIVALQYVVPLLAVVAAEMSPIVPSEFGNGHDLEFLPLVVGVFWIPTCMIVSTVPMGIILKELWNRKRQRTSKPTVP
jgi:hypothetical protein